MLRFTITMFLSATLFGASLVPSAAAQSITESRLEVRPFIGAFIPTGSQRDMLDNAVTVGFQGAYAVMSYLSIVGTFSVTPSSDTRAALDDDLDVFSYDIGAELQKSFIMTSTGMTLSPFIGLGAGGRTYDYRDRVTHAESNIAAYGAVGAQLRMGSIGLRLEARDYVSSFTGLTGEMTRRETRNDLAILSALSFPF